MTVPENSNSRVKVLRENEDGEISTDVFTNVWAGYLNGHWTMEKPKGRGRYPIADRKGHFAGIVECDKIYETGEIVCDKKWDGWFWSYPLPPPPYSAPREWPIPEPHLKLVKSDRS